jgi:translation elongation factor EF-G
MQGVKERATKLVQVHADETRQVDAVGAGNIAALQVRVDRVFIDGSGAVMVARTTEYL